jgi:hypothetical protein
MINVPDEAKADYITKSLIKESTIAYYTNIILGEGSFNTVVY